MSETKLKPCPKCGSKAVVKKIVLKELRGIIITIECEDPKCNTKVVGRLSDKFNEKDVYKFWNKRGMKWEVIARD